MSRRYQALQRSGGLAALGPDLSTNRVRTTGARFPEIPASFPQDITLAVADLLHNKLLIHSFGDQGEWEVRSTLSADRQAWRFRELQSRATTFQPT